MATKKRLEDPAKREKSLAERFAEKKEAESLAKKFAEKKRLEKEKLKELKMKAKAAKKPFFTRLFKKSKKNASAEAPKEETPAEKPADAPAEKPVDAPAEAPKEDAPQEKPKEEPPKEDKPEEKKEESPKEEKPPEAPEPKPAKEKSKDASKKTSFFARMFKKSAKSTVEPEKPAPEKTPEKIPEKPPEKKTEVPEKKTETKKDKKEAVEKRSLFARLFKKAPKEEKKAEPEKGKKKKKRLSLLDMVKKTKKKRERRSTLQQRRVLADLIRKAGYEINPEKLKRVVFYTTFVVISLFTFITLIFAASVGKSAGKLLLSYLGVWTAVFAFVYIFIWMVIYFYLDIRIYNRTQELEDVLPDFLQLASANISAGMPIDRALWFAVRPNFGVLAKEIEEVAKSTLAGEELAESLIKFTERYDSVTLKRSINILLEGLAAGGEIADLLNKIALNIQETKIQRKEMSANVATYAIFITFASIIMAPLLFALATELLIIIVRITSTLDLSGSAQSFITLNINTSMEMVKDFQAFCILMLTISALMSASIVSVIRRGRIKEGLRNLPIFVVVSLLIYFFASQALHAMLGGLI